MAWKFFSNESLSRCDGFCQFLVQIGAVLAIFRLFQIFRAVSINSSVGRRESTASGRDRRLSNKQSEKKLWNATSLARKQSLSEMSVPKSSTTLFVKKIVHSDQFDYFVGGVILLNSIFNAVSEIRADRNSMT